MCTLGCICSYTSLRLSISFDSSASKQFSLIVGKSLTSIKHRSKFLFSRSLISGLSLLRSWSTGQYSAHAPRNVRPFPLKRSSSVMKPSKFSNVCWQFVHTAISFFLYFSYPPLFLNALDDQFWVSLVFKGWEDIIAFLRFGSLKSAILLCKTRGLKKWLTAIDAPTNLLSLCVTSASTLGLNMFLLSRNCRKSFACIHTSSAWSLLPSRLPSWWSVMSLIWKMNKRHLMISFGHWNQSSRLFVGRSLWFGELPIADVRLKQPEYNSTRVSTAMYISLLY